MTRFWDPWLTAAALSPMLFDEAIDYQNVRIESNWLELERREAICREKRKLIGPVPKLPRGYWNQ